MLWKAGVLRTCRDEWELTPVLFLFFAPRRWQTHKCFGQKAPGPPPAQIEQTSYDIRATAGSEVIEVDVCADSMIHVAATPAASAPASPRPWMLDAQPILS